MKLLPIAIALLPTTCCIAAGLDDFFDQVPESKRKAFNSNRPTQVDTAYTLDPGVIQLETAAGLFVYDHHTPDSSQFESFTLGQTNIRLGVTENFELQALVTPYVWANKTDATGTTTHDSGIGDVTLRTFFSLQGNDGNGLGVAFMPFVKLPTNGSDEGLFGNNRVEGGFEIPLGYALDAKTSLASSPGVSFDWNGDAYDANPYATLAIFRTLPCSAIVFGEVFAKRLTGQGDDAVIAQFDFGAVFPITRDFSWDIAVYRGLTTAAPDWVLQTGFALRF